MKRRPKGSGTIRKRGGFYSITYGTRAAPQHEGGFRTKAEAERRLTLIRAEAMQRRLGHAADPRLTPTLAVLADPWLERRKLTKKAWREDGYRWRKHLAPHFGHLRPDEVDHARIRAFAEAKLREGLASGTVRVCVSVLSGLYADLQERGLAASDPARGLPKSLAALVRPSHDPTTTPFIERIADVRRVFLALPEPVNIGYALGALAGLRPGEAFALRWEQVDLDRRVIHVQRSVTGTTKGKRARQVMIQDALLPVLKAWRLSSGGVGLVCPPLRSDGTKIDKGTRGAAVREALRGAGLHVLAEHPKAWYCASRHTFASQWVMAGGSIRELQKVLGHYSVVMTERYAHLAPDFFSPGSARLLAVDLSAGGEVASIADHSGQAPSALPPSIRKRKRNAGAAL
jgi:integrase